MHGRSPQSTDQGPLMLKWPGWCEWLRNHLEPIACFPGGSLMISQVPVFCAPSAGTIDELTCYLNTMPKDIKNKEVLKWWYEHKHVFPCLYQMALNYHTVPCKLIFSTFLTIV